MAFDGFLRIEGIKGESPDKNYPGDANWIDIKEFTYGVTQPDSTSSGGGLSTGKCTLDKFNFKQGLHTGSAMMYVYCATGKHIKKVEFKARKAAGEKQEVYLDVLFENCMITKVNVSGSGDELPTEDIDIAYQKVTITYSLQDNATGKMTPQTPTMFDQKTNTSSISK